MVLLIAGIVGGFVLLALGKLTSEDIARIILAVKGIQ
jgi:hypothetical protein